MFIASGAVVIQRFEYERSEKGLKTIGIILGSLCIVTGILFAVELAILLKKLLKK